MPPVSALWADSGRGHAATGTAEREAAVEMITGVIPAGQDVAAAPTTAGAPRITLGADKGYDAAGFIDELTGLNVDPHVAQNTSGRRSAVPDKVAAKPGYATSQRIRKRIEEIFGWMKTVGGMRKLHHRGTALVGWLFTFSAAAYNLVRLSRLIPVAA